MKSNQNIERERERQMRRVHGNEGGGGAAYCFDYHVRSGRWDTFSKLKYRLLNLSGEQLHEYSSVQLSSRGR